MSDITVSLRLTLKDMASTGVKDFRKQFQAGMAGVRADAAGTAGAMRASMASISAQLATLQRAVIAYQSVMGALRAGTAIIRAADDFKSLQARLKLATGSIQGAGVALDDVRRIAAANGQEIGAVGTLYGRLATAIRDMGGSQEMAAKVTEAVTMALRISGAGAAEAASATLQLGQAFASGALRGDEFNSINEAAPRIMQALAEHLGVSRGKLREMAEAGQLTADVMGGALLGSIEKLRTEAAELPDTMEQASARMKNSWVELVAQFDRQTGASQSVSSAMNGLAANMGDVVDVGIGLAQIIGVVIGARMYAAAKAAGAAGTALGTLGKVAGVALRVLGGWPGLLLSLAVAAFGFYRNWKSGEDALTESRLKSAVALGDLLAVNQQYAGAQRQSIDVVKQLGAAELQRYHDSIQGAIAYYNGLIEQERRLGSGANQEVIRSLAAKRDAYIRANAEMRPIFLQRQAAERDHGQKLGVELDIQAADVQAAMAEQKKEYSQALADLEGAQKKEEEILKRQREFRTRLNAGPDVQPEEVTALYIGGLVAQARAAFAGGDAERGFQTVERARDTLIALRDAGTYTSLVLNGLAGELEQIETAGAKSDTQSKQAAIEVAYNKMLELQAIAKSLEAVKIGVDKSAASVAILSAREALQAFADENPIIFKAITKAQDQALLEQNYKVPGMASGGPIAGQGPLGVDSQIILAAPGEHMLTAAEVAAAGGHGAIYRLRAALLSGALKGYAKGGAIIASSSVVRAVSAMPPVTAASAPAFPHLGRIDIGLGGGTYPVYAEAGVTESLRAQLSLERMKRGRR